MRLTYLCLQPRSGSGASDTHVDGIIGALRRRGVTVELLELRTSSSSLVVRLLAGLWLQVRHWRRLRQSTAVYARMHPTAVLLPWLIGRTPLLVEVNGVPEDYVVAHPGLRPVEALIRFAVARVLRRSDRVLVVTEGLRRRVLEWAPAAQVTVLPNAADPERFRPGLPRPDDVPGGPYALFFGALALWQGLELVLDAVEDQDWPTDLRLVVVGEGPVGQLVRHAAARCPDRIVVLGARRADVLPAYVANAELSFVLKNYHDRTAGQSPLKLYESMAAGTPVVATPLHGCTDVEALKPGIFQAEPTPSGVLAAMARCREAVLARDRTLEFTFAEVRRSETWDTRALVICSAVLDCGQRR